MDCPLSDRFGHVFSTLWTFVKGRVQIYITWLTSDCNEVTHEHFKKTEDSMRLMIGTVLSQCVKGALHL